MKRIIHLLLLIIILPGIVEAVPDSASSLHVYRIKKAPSYKASVELPKMNVVYIQVPNPLDIRVPGYSDFDVKVSEGEIHKEGKNWILNINKPGAVTVSIHTKTGKLIDTRVFRVKRVPDPIATLGGIYTGGMISKNELLAAGNLIPVLRDFDYDFTMQIISYQIFCGGERIDGFVADVTGNALTDRMKAVIAKMPAGSKIRFEFIKCRLLRTTDSPAGNLQPLEFVLN